MKGANALVVVGMLGACAQPPAAPPPSLADQISGSVRDRADAVAVTIGEPAEVGDLTVSVARIGPDGVDMSLQAPGGDSVTSRLEVGDRAELGTAGVRLVDVAAGTVWVVPAAADPGPATEVRTEAHPDRRALVGQDRA